MPAAVVFAPAMATSVPDAPCTARNLPSSWAMLSRDWTLDAQGIRRDASYGNYPMKTKKGEAHKGTWQVTEIIAYLQVPGGICAQRAVWPVGISAIIGRRENKTAG